MLVSFSWSANAHTCALRFYMQKPTTKIGDEKKLFDWLSLALGC